MLDVSIRRVKSLKDLWAQMSEVKGRCHLLAGGTDLVVKARAGSVPPSTWFDITSVRALHGIRLTRRYLDIGALVTYAQMERSVPVRVHAPALLEACREFAAPPIRNMGTLGGNFANASPAADGIPPVMAMDGVLCLEGPRGKREVPATSFCTAPGRTVLKKGEVITRILLPRYDGHRGYFFKLGPRALQAISKVSLALVGRVVSGRFSDVRIAMGAVGPTVLRALETERFLEGREVTDAVIAQAMTRVRQECRPITDARSTAAYRKDMVGILAGRGLEALGGFQGG